MTSTRLPGKVLMEAAGKPMLELMVERLSRVPRLDAIIIATTTNAADDAVVALAERLGVLCHRGPEHDVLARVLAAARANDVDVIVEMTGDCPLIDPDIVGTVVDAYLEDSVDYVSNVLAPRSFPVGMDTQVFAADVLADVADRTADPDDREHVSLYIYNNPQRYRVKAVRAPTAYHAPGIRLTLDTPEDLVLIRSVFDRLYHKNPAFGLGDILELLSDSGADRAGLVDARR